MNELKSILHYIYLLQSSIEYRSRIDPLTSNVTVYRGIQFDGTTLIPLDESTIEAVIVWPDFTSTSTNRDHVIDSFITRRDSILFVILLHPGDVAVCIPDSSECPTESEVLIAASSGFIVESVDSVDVQVRTAHGVAQLTIPVVTLSYWLSWSDFGVDDRLRTTVV
jgi:hypothetical protein